MLNSLIVGCLVLCFAGPALAAGDTTCRSEKGRLDEQLNNVAEWDNRIPGVPPNDVAYMEKEWQAIRNVDLPSAERQMRFSLLMKQPYFYTYELHQAFKKVTESTQKAMAASKPQDRMVGAARAMMDAESAQSAMTDYANAHPGPETPRAFIAVPMRVFAWQLTYYIECEAKTIP